MSIDKVIDESVRPVAEAISAVIFYAEPFTGFDIKLIVVWLALPALFFTFYLGFPNLRFFGHAVDLVRGKHREPGADGQISSFQALMTSLSGTVGLGNIAGVAVAVSVGGPGAVFWMVVMGVLGMASKFAEVTLGVKYRTHADKENPDRLSGGPMYYLKEGFSRTGLPWLGKALAVAFAACVVAGAIGGGNMFQANQTFQQVVNVTGGAEGFMADKGWLFGIFLSFLVGIVIIGGIRSIASVSGKIVPIMGLVYLISGLVVIAMFYENIPAAVGTIVTMALTPEAGIGGVIGAMLMGVQRAAFSNEAGIGSGAIVHAAAMTNRPVSQGVVGMLGPFIDTVVICTVTGLVIVVTGAYQGGQGMEGVVLASRAFEQGIPWFPYIMAFTVFLFAYSTLIAWGYCGLKGVTYLFGQSRAVEMAYKVIFCVFVVIGAACSMDNIVLLSDASFFAMAIPNIIGLYLFAPELKRDLKAYAQLIQSERQNDKA